MPFGPAGVSCPGDLSARRCSDSVKSMRGRDVGNSVVSSPSGIAGGRDLGSVEFMALEADARFVQDMVRSGEFVMAEAIFPLNMEGSVSFFE